MQRKQQAMSGGGTIKTPKTPKIGDDPAVKSITARITAFKRQQDATKLNLKAEVESAKAWEKAEKKRADASQKAADATKKAADEAAAALTKAQDRKTKADQNVSRFTSSPNSPGGTGVVLGGLVGMGASSSEKADRMRAAPPDGGGRKRSPHPRSGVGRHLLT